MTRTLLIALVIAALFTWAVIFIAGLRLGDRLIERTPVRAPTCSADAIIVEHAEACGWHLQACRQELDVLRGDARQRTPTATR